MSTLRVHKSDFPPNLHNRTVAVCGRLVMPARIYASTDWKQVTCLKCLHKNAH